jgi:chaperonin cofactor prefoldin
LRVRRRSSHASTRSTARELQLPKTVELEQRISRLEMKIQRACEELDLTRQRLSALQAKLDHYYAARFGHL